MRPILLEIEGLQSFRESQTIDFSILGETGLFGIFGPTGSGKSTVLDAITYALYGRVKRADRGTQGIIHSERRTASVSFTFALRGPEGPRTYRVERTCQRKKGSDHASETKTARLVRLSDAGEIPVSDKSGEVTEAIFSLIGLNHEDFTKAVVLPQGSFAEFLQLDGTKKREMLERTFYLEAYGRELQDKLMRRMAQVSRETERTAGELAGYADATPEALALSEAMLSETTLVREEMETAWRETDRTFRAVSALHDLTVEAKLAGKVLAALEEHAGVDAERRGRRDAALRAGALREPLRRFHEAQAAVAENSKALLPLLDRLPVMREETGRMGAEQERLQREETIDVPVWNRLKYQLEDSVSVLKEWEIMRAEAAKALAMQQREAIAMKDAVAAMTLEEAAGKRLESTFEELRFSLEATRVQTQRREALSDAIGKQHVWEMQEEQWRDLETRRMKEAETIAAHEENLSDRRKEWERCQTMLAIAAAEMARLEPMAPGNRNDLLREHASLQAASVLARRMADELLPGMPCPVCGATEHPALGRQPHGETEAESGASLNVLSAEFPREAAGVVNEPPVGSATEPDPSGYRQRMNAIESSLNALEGWELQMREASGNFQQAKEHAVMAEALLKTGEAGLQERREAHDSLAAVSAEKKEQRNRAFLDLDACLRLQEVTSLRQFSDEIAGMDQRHAVLSQESERLEKELGDVRNRLNGLTQRRDSLGRETARQEAEAKGLTERAGALEDKLREKLAGMPVEMTLDPSALSRLLAETEDRLRKHAVWFAENTRAWNAGQADLRGLETQVAMLGDRQSILEKIHAAESAVLKGELERHGFGSTEEAETAILSGTVLADLETAISEYARKKQQAEDECRRIAIRLDGCSLTEDEWIAAKNGWQAADEKRKGATASHEIARNACVVLKERNLRWQDLTARAESLSNQSGMLGQIQKVLKGDRGRDNSFIDYVAEARLRQIAAAASVMLHDMTRGKFELVLDTESGFLIRDFANGGLYRPVSSLSGGETFLTSLALALALSAQIQLKGQCPLEFFFLDEGFGTLDAELLDTVMDALTRLSREDRIIGLISHVPEMKARMSRRLMITPPGREGEGSRVRLEKA